MGTNADMVKGAIIAAVTMIQALFYRTMHTPVNVFHTQTPFMRCVPLYGTFIVCSVTTVFIHTLNGFLPSEYDPSGQQDDRHKELTDRKPSFPPLCHSRKDSR